MSSTNGTTNGHSTGASSADEAIDHLYAWMPPQSIPQSCPEAAFSLTLKGRIDGHEALLTARGQTADEFRDNLQAIRGLLDQPAQSPAPAPTPQGEGWCAVHQTAMQWNTGRDGRKGWYSHRHDGQWCTGKARRP